MVKNKMREKPDINIKISWISWMCKLRVFSNSTLNM